MPTRPCPGQLLVITSWTKPSGKHAADVPDLCLATSAPLTWVQSYRERSDGLYHTLTYITAKVAEEMVIAFLGSLIFSNWIWWSTEFRGSYALFLLVHYACTCTGIGTWHFPMSLLAPGHSLNSLFWWAV